MALNYLQDLLSLISPLNRVQHISLSIASAEVQFQNYVEFTVLEGWGNPDILRSLLDHVWVGLEAQAPFSHDNINDCINSLDGICPDLDGFNSDFATYALDACRSMDHTLRAIHGDSCLEALYAGQASYETVDCFIQIEEDLDPQDALLETKIEEHPMMLRELKRQHENIELISSTSNLTRKMVELLRYNSVRHRSNIKVP